MIQMSPLRGLVVDVNAFLQRYHPYGIKEILNFSRFLCESGAVRKPHLPAWGPWDCFFKIDVYGRIAPADICVNLSLQNPHCHLTRTTIAPRIIRNRCNVYLLSCRCRDIELIFPLGIVQYAARATDNCHAAQ